MEIQEALKNKYQIDFDKIDVAGDGGTICFELIDSDNVHHLLFIDRRIESKTINQLYANKYPSEPDSVLLGTDEELLNTLERNISLHTTKHKPQ
ncbi:MAG: hypothetical protein ACPGTP_02820 [Bacteroidia bacterium]